MAILPPNSDYTSKDFEALNTRLESLLRSVFPTWTDHRIINFGNVLKEMPCFVGDVLSYNQDANARESRILTATQRRNVLALIKVIDYTPARASAATVDQRFEFEGLTANVELQAGQIVKTEGESPIEFQLLSPITATPGSPIVTVTAEHSKTHEQVEQGTEVADQAFALDENPFLTIVSIVGASSGQWTEVDDFLSSGPSDKHFVVRIDNAEKATVIFGNGTAGAMPADVLTITYKTGGGLEGNVAPDSLTKVDGGLLDVDGNPVTFTTTNVFKASGGDNPESLEAIKAHAPASIRNPVTTVAREDYEDHATDPTLVSGISRALMLTHDEDVTIPDNAGRLYVVPTGDLAPQSPGFPSASKLQEVRAVFVGNTQSRAPRPAVLTRGLVTLAATYVDVTLHQKIYLTKEAAANADTKHAVKVAVDAAFVEFFRPKRADGTNNPNVDFGFYLRQRAVDEAQGQIALSDLTDVVKDTPGVRKLGTIASDSAVTTEMLESGGSPVAVQTDEHADVRVDDTWFPRFKATVLIDGDTGLEIL